MNYDSHSSSNCSNMDPDLLPRSIFECTLCDETFRRQDHLRRHELGHRSPQFQCDDVGCAMFFHRKDVLKRHQRVHLPNQTKKRRRPRRGLFPNPVTTNRLPSPSPSATLAVEQSAAVPLPLSELSPIKDPSSNFCLLHFRQCYLSRMPILHHSTLSNTSLPEEMILAMAAHGVSGFQEFQLTSQVYFQRARELSRKSEVRHQSPGAFDQEMEYVRKLQHVQTCLMLLDYAIWHGDSAKRTWGLATIIPTMAEALSLWDQLILCDFIDISTSWKGWVRQEELRRAIFALYCVAVKASHVCVSTLMLPSRIKTLKLSCTEALFTAETECDWLAAAFDCDAATESYFDLEMALFSLFNSGQPWQCALESLSPFGCHILYCAILESFSGSLKNLANFVTLHGYTDEDSAQFIMRERFKKVLTVCRAIWWYDLPELWATRSHEVLKLQNNLLLMYLEVRLLRTGRPEESPTHEFRAAATIGLDFLSGIMKGGILDIAVKFRWTFDQHCLHHTCYLAKTLLEWLSIVESGEDHDELRGEDSKIYVGVLQAIWLSLTDFTNGGRARDKLIDIWNIVVPGGLNEF